MNCLYAAQEALISKAYHYEFLPIAHMAFLLCFKLLYRIYIGNFLN